MGTWLYQLAENEWSINNYRLDIWEGERWRWPVGQIRGSESHPQPGYPEPGDVVFFCYTKTSKEPGFCGWAVVQQWEDEGGDKKRFYFRPVAPSDQLKMHPWGDGEAFDLVARVRRDWNQATLYFVDQDLAEEIVEGIKAWV